MSIFPCKQDLAYKWSNREISADNKVLLYSIIIILLFTLIPIYN